jgi:hypothetical protein
MYRLTLFSKRYRMSIARSRTGATTVRANGYSFGPDIRLIILSGNLDDLRQIMSIKLLGKLIALYEHGVLDSTIWQFAPA